MRVQGFNKITDGILGSLIALAIQTGLLTALMATAGGRETLYNCHQIFD